MVFIVGNDGNLTKRSKAIWDLTGRAFRAWQCSDIRLQCESVDAAMDAMDMILLTAFTAYERTAGGGADG